ncbi:MAG: transcriptional repressor [Saonia sp.]
MKRRNTFSKQEILATLQSADSALSHDMIQSEISTVDRATIYRVLNRFHEDGVVHRIVGDDGKHYFALCIACENHIHRHNHFHFRCISCGNVECLKKEIIVSLPDGYVSESFNGMISGRCKECALS